MAFNGMPQAVRAVAVTDAADGAGPLDRLARPGRVQATVKREQEESATPEALYATRVAHRRKLMGILDSRFDYMDVGLYDQSALGPNATKHYLWVPEWAALGSLDALYCGIALFFSGILCSAGGIGGGGIYVTVLMVCGAVTVKDAIPLSKAIVFLGSVASLVLNLPKVFSQNGVTVSVIDFNICRLVVPAALAGTFFGVLFNQICPAWVILAALCVILVGMTVMVARSCFIQYRKEREAAVEVPHQTPSNDGPRLENPQENDAGEPFDGSGGSSREHPKASPAPPSSRSPRTDEDDEDEHALQPKAVDAVTPRNLVTGTDADSSLKDMDGNPQQARLAHASTGTTSLNASQSLKSELRKSDILFGLSMLTIVIAFSVFRTHAAQCATASSSEAAQVCYHPILAWLGPNKLQLWMRDSGPMLPILLLSIAFGVPLAFCAAISVYYMNLLLYHEQNVWTPCNIVFYQAMAFVTGCLAGLVGIGGGLVFSPFFLLMGVEPSIAVATSSTCVIFTAASTTFQYLLTDRVIVSLTFMYGLVNVVASYLGTKLVHYLQDHYSARSSFISAIVLVGVMISTVLSLVKLFGTNPIAQLLSSFPQFG